MIPATLKTRTLDRSFFWFRRTATLAECDFGAALTRAVRLNLQEHLTAPDSKAMSGKHARSCVENEEAQELPSLEP